MPAAVVTLVITTARPECPTARAIDASRSAPSARKRYARARMWTASQIPTREQEDGQDLHRGGARDAEHHHDAEGAPDGERDHGEGQQDTADAAEQQRQQHAHHEQRHRDQRGEVLVHAAVDALGHRERTAQVQLEVVALVLGQHGLQGVGQRLALGTGQERNLDLGAVVRRLELRQGIDGGSGLGVGHRTDRDRGDATIGGEQRVDVERIRAGDPARALDGLRRFGPGIEQLLDEQRALAATGHPGIDEAVYLLHVGHAILDGFVQRAEPLEELTLEDRGAGDGDEQTVVPAELVAKRVVGHDLGIVGQQEGLGGVVHGDLGHVAQAEQRERQAPEQRPPAMPTHRVAPALEARPRPGARHPGVRAASAPLPPSSICLFLPGPGGPASPSQGARPRRSPSRYRASPSASATARILRAP